MPDPLCVQIGSFIVSWDNDLLCAALGGNRFELRSLIEDSPQDGLSWRRVSTPRGVVCVLKWSTARCFTEWFEWFNDQFETLGHHV